MPIPITLAITTVRQLVLHAWCERDVTWSTDEYGQSLPQSLALLAGARDSETSVVVVTGHCRARLASRETIGNWPACVCMYTVVETGRN